MPVQQQMSSFAKRLGGRVSQANAEHADKPVDTGNRRLPSGIRDGVAKLSTMYTKEQDADGGKTPKGETFFRASAIVVSPAEHNGEKITGMVTQVVIPICDVPAKGMRKAVSLSDNWFEFQNVFKLLGQAPCPETPQTDPTGQRTEAYFFALIKLLTDPIRMKTNPVYISFSTRGWTPPATSTQPKPEEMVFEDWHGLAKFDGTHNPAAGMVDNTAPPPPTPYQPPMNAPPPPQLPPQTQTATSQGAAPPPTNSPPPQYQPDNEADQADIVAALVETAMGDPEGEEGAAASAQLEQMAWAAGWTKEQTAGAADWEAVGDMALTNMTVPPVQTATAAPLPPAGNPTVGSRWMFARRTKDGEKLKNNKGEPFPAQEVEVTAVNAVEKVVILKTIKDGKDIVDIRTKKPIAVKFEWLEQAPPY